MPVDELEDAASPDFALLLRAMQEVLARVEAGSLPASEAARQLETLLGPPVRPTSPAHQWPAPPDDKVRDKLVDGCRLELDRVRAEIVSPSDGLEAIGRRLKQALAGPGAGDPRIDG